MNESPMQIRAVELTDHQQLIQLLDYSLYVHRHLDWYEPVDWIGRQPFIAVEWNNQISAVLACPPDPGEIAWIRLFAVSSEVTVRNAWGRLWPVILEMITGKSLTVAAIPLFPWFREILTDSHFKHVTDVVLLLYDHFPPSPSQNEFPFMIREMGSDDLPIIAKVDVRAFKPLWQYSQPSLKNAWSKSTLATVAEANGEIIGYQMSTASSSGGHLARLAVLPDWQGCGVGTVLVNQMLTRFHLWGSLRVTVNTQVDNQASLSLYEKIGFIRTDEAYRVYQFNP